MGLNTEYMKMLNNNRKRNNLTKMSKRLEQMLKKIKQADGMSQQAEKWDYVRRFQRMVSCLIG